MLNHVNLYVLVYSLPICCLFCNINLHNLCGTLYFFCYLFTLHYIDIELYSYQDSTLDSEIWFNLGLYIICECLGFCIIYLKTVINKIVSLFMDVVYIWLNHVNLYVLDILLVYFLPIYNLFYNINLHSLYETLFFFVIHSLYITLM